MTFNGITDAETAVLINSSDHPNPLSSSYTSTISTMSNSTMSNSAVMDEAFNTVSKLLDDNKSLKGTVDANNEFMKKQCDVIKTLREEREEEQKDIKEKADQAKKVITTLSNTVDLKNKTIEDLSEKLRDYQDRSMRHSIHDSQRSISSDRSLVTAVSLENVQQQWEAEKEKLQCMIHKLESEKNDLLALNSDLNLQLHTSKKKGTPDGEVVANNGFVMLAKPASAAAPERVSMQTAAARVKDCSADTGQQNSISDLLKQLRAEQANVTRCQGLLTHRENEVKELSRQLKQTKDDLQMVNVNSEKQETILKGNIITILAELKDSESKQVTAEKDLQTFKERCANNEVRFTHYRDQVAKDENQLKRNDYDLASLREENRRITESQQHMRIEFDQACIEIRRLMDEIEKRDNAMKTSSLEHQTGMRNLSIRFQEMQRTLADTAEENRRLLGRVGQQQNTVEVLECQAEVFKTDFEEERLSKEKLHEDRERLVEEKKGIVHEKNRVEEQMRALQTQNAQLADEVRIVTNENDMLQEKLAAHNQDAIMTLQRRHGTFKAPGAAGGAHAWYDQGDRDPNRVGGNPIEGATGDHQNRGYIAHADEHHGFGRLEEESPLEYKCPICDQTLPDLDSLNLHCDECIT